MRDQTYSKKLIRCWAVIENESYDLVQVSIDFTLNSIPTANATIALGRDVDHTEVAYFVGRAANINEKFLFRKPIKIYASYILQDETPDLQAFDAAVPSFKNKIIFDGYVAGFGFQRNSAASVLTISIEHWLADLSASSIISTAMHYTTPTDLQRSAVLSSPTAAAFLSAGNLSGDGQAAPENDLSVLPVSWFLDATGYADDVPQDIWENGIKKMLLKSAQTDNLAELNRSVETANCPYNNPFNSAAISALTKMTSANAPLSIRLLSNDATDIAKNITNCLEMQWVDTLAGQNMWDNIISTSADFMYAVVPHILTAEVVPYCPTTTNNPPYASIKANQIESISLSGDCPRTLRGVAILVRQGPSALIPDDDQSFTPEPEVYGSYMNDSTGCKGTVLFKNPPIWMGIDPNHFSTGPDKFADDVKNAVNPDPDGAVKSDKKSIDQVSKDMKPVRDAYAQVVYGNEIIKGRQGTITGPLRFDIGVGSIIEFELPEDYHTPSTTENKYFYGTVIRVSSILDANSMIASTTFTVAHIRTYAEETNTNGFMIDYHPIYENKWIGNRLDV